MQPKRETFHSRTILIVDDDIVIRTLIQAILSNEGYATLCAQDGQEALELSRKHAGEINLVVSDVVMPRMSGAALAERLATERPQASILFISGYTDLAELPEDSEFLQKPFGLEVLLCRVRQLLRLTLPSRITPKADTNRLADVSMHKLG